MARRMDIQNVGREPKDTAESVTSGWERGQEPLREGGVERRTNPLNQPRSPVDWRTGTKTDMVY